MIGLAWPKTGEAIIHSLQPAAGNEPVQSVALLGGSGDLHFEQRPDGLHVQLPSQAAFNYAYSLRITFSGSSH